MSCWLPCPLAEGEFNKTINTYMAATLEVPKRKTLYPKCQEISATTLNNDTDLYEWMYTFFLVQFTMVSTFQKEGSTLMLPPRRLAKHDRC